MAGRHPVSFLICYFFPVSWERTHMAMGIFPGTFPYHFMSAAS
jgi:hypothetical protein